MFGAQISLKLYSADINPQDDKVISAMQRHCLNKTL